MTNLLAKGKNISKKTSNSIHNPTCSTVDSVRRLLSFSGIYSRERRDLSLGKGFVRGNKPEAAISGSFSAKITLR